MNALTARGPAVTAAMAGCLLLVIGSSPRSGVGLPPFLDTPEYADFSTPPGLLQWLILAVPAIATAFGLCLLRWWPYLLALAALLTVPSIAAEQGLVTYPGLFALLPVAGYYLAIVAVLACAQGLIRTAVGWGAAVAALTLGFRLVGSAMAGGLSWETSLHTVAAWHTFLLLAGVAGLPPAMWRYRRGDPSAIGPVGDRSWQRVRLISAGALAASAPIPLALLTTQRLADLLGITWFALSRHSYAETAILGAITLVAVALLAALAGLWPLAGTLTAAVAQVSVVAPAMLAVTALSLNDPVRWLAALAGAALGAALAASRWRFPLAATLTVLAATALFIAYGATGGDPAKLADQRIVVPAVLILVLCAGAAGAVVGATAPVLAAQGALPAVLGPLAGALAVGGLQTIQVTYLRGGLPEPSILNPVYHLTTSAILLLVAGAAIGGLGIAQQLATRRAERKQAEQIRREAADAERDRLARPIHDGVLQVLALVQRHGSELGRQGNELAALAGEQEAALRRLLTGKADNVSAADDLRAALQGLAALAVEVSTPAEAVVLPAGTVAEVVAAVRAALDNVRRHAGPDARAWILLEDEGDGVRVTIRDDGVGFAPERLGEAAEAGRLGVAQSMRGRIADYGGTMAIYSRPGEGTEVEFWVPRGLSGRK